MGVSAVLFFKKFRCAWEVRKPEVDAVKRAEDLLNSVVKHCRDAVLELTSCLFVHLFVCLSIVCRCVPCRNTTRFSTTPEVKRACRLP